MKQLLTFLALSIFGFAMMQPALVDAKLRPNVLLIYGDDVGYGDVGVYGSKLIPTPHIDKLASEGLRFTDGHCGGSTCSASRFTMLTGIYAFRKKVIVLPPNAPLKIPPNKTTLAQVFKKAGYRTAVIGKWHVGIGKPGKKPNWNKEVLPGPLEVGFDYCFLLPSTADRVPTVYLENHHVVNLDPNDPIYVGKSKKAVDHPGSTPYPDGKKHPEAMTYYKSTHGHNNSVINGIGRMGYMAGGKSALWNGETMSDEFVKRAKAFIKKDPSKPFFVFFSASDIHVPRTPNPRFRGKTTLGYRGDAMVQFDDAVGQLMKFLKDSGLKKNTIVIFSSDNGPVYDDGYDDGTSVHTSTKPCDHGHYGAGPFRGGKYQLYEGGTRVPFIISWPAKIKPGVSKALVTQANFVPSFAALLGVKLNPGDAPDAQNTIKAFMGLDPIGSQYVLEEAPRGIALRFKNWKYIRHGKGKKAKRAELYNLDKDIGEKHNVISQHPEIAQKMEKKLNEMTKKIKL